MTIRDNIGKLKMLKLLIPKKEKRSKSEIASYLAVTVLFDKTKK
jgi:hypothetical protein